MTDPLEPLKGFFHRVKRGVSRRRLSDESGLHIVKDPDDAEIDIVAVHGLGGAGFSSWITVDSRTGKQKSWLEELLGEDVPNARILTYGYVTEGVNYRYLVRNVLYGRALDLVQELSGQRDRDGTSRRPIFFIAHSLGGWIVKRALILSKETGELQLRDIELSTCGVAFFGTLSPGKPSSPSPIASVIRRTSFPFREDLRRSMSGRASPQQDPQDAVWLENQMEGFKSITSNLTRLSFYETKQSFDGFVVEKQYSVVGSDGMQVPLTSNHADLIKFRGRDDANYKQFLSKFKAMIDASRSSGFLDAKRKSWDLATVHRPDYLDADFSVSYPLPETSLVIQRDELMSQLEESLQPLEDTQQMRIRMSNLWGLPGSGKTTLARSYAETHKADISFVFWVWAESWESVITSFLQFALCIVRHYTSHAPQEDVESHLGLTGIEDMLKTKSILQLNILAVKSVVQAVKDWLLRPKNDKWLLILDHVEPSFDIFDFIPLTRSGRIIITTRELECCAWGSKLLVGPMTAEQSLALLSQTLERDPTSDEDEAKAAKTVVEGLNCHPRNISLTAAQIRRKGISISHYLARYELKSPGNGTKSHIDQSPFAETILNISAMLSPSAVPVALFTTNLASLKETPKRYRKTLTNMKALLQYGNLDDALVYLFDHDYIQSPSPTTDSAPSSQSFSQSTGSSSSTTLDTFLLDSSVRLDIRGKLTEGELAEYAWLACMLCVDCLQRRDLESDTLPEIHEFARVMGPHARVCYEDWGHLLQRWPEENNVPWYVLGRVCMTQGAMEQAAGCFELSLQHPHTLEPMEKIQTSLWLASVLRKNGQPERSWEVLNDIDVRFIDQAALFRIKKARASASAAEGELARAEGDLEMLEQEQANALGDMDISTVDTVHQLASTLEQMGKTEEAQALYRRVWLSCQGLFGPNHPTTLAALEDLARISLDSHAIDEAEALYEQLVAINKRTLGEDHPNTAQAILRLALIDDIRCRYDSARAKYERALQALSALGKANPAYTTAAENLALSSRWHGQSLTDEEGDTDKDMSDVLENDDEDDDSRTVRAATPSTVHRASRTNTEAKRLDTTAAAAFATAERLYLEILSIKISAKDMYSDEDILETGSKLSEMYENERFFERSRRDKIKALRALLAGVRMGVGGRMGMLGSMRGASSMSDVSMENWR